MLSDINSYSWGMDPEESRGILRLLANPLKRRIIVRKGLEYIPLRMEDIALMHTESKMVFVTDLYGKKYVGEGNLSQMMECLDTNSFFRANRQYIVNIAFIKSFKTYEKVKLQVLFTFPESERHHVIVSQEMAPHFRKWMAGE